MSQNKSKSREKGSNRALWPILIAVAGLILLIAGLLWVFGRSSDTATIEVTGNPSLKVGQEKIDLGDIRLGEWVNVSFKVTNVGDQALLFTKKPYIQVAEGC